MNDPNQLVWVLYDLMPMAKTPPVFTDRGEAFEAAAKIVRNRRCRQVSQALAFFGPDDETPTHLLFEMTREQAVSMRLIES